MVVVGAGVVGLAIARALALAGREVLVLEAADSFGTATSARNSEVIHAGIYYPPGSLKARLCVAGRDQLYDFCERRGVAYRRCGKLIVGSLAEERELDSIAANAAANGVELERLGRAALRAREPALRCHTALRSAHTGIVDSHGLMLALAGEAQSHGARFAYRTRVSRLWLTPGDITLAVDGGHPTLRAALLVNAAGLAAPALARATEGLPAARVPTAHFAKGSYFALAVRAPFTHLIYPVPQPGGLGVHLTLDLSGRGRFGPDVEWLASGELPHGERDYRVDARRAEGFYGAIRRYWPDLPDGALEPAFAGIRPKLSGPGEPPADFRIDGPEECGGPLVNLFGIESPGLTASLAIAAHVATLLRGVI